MKVLPLLLISFLMTFSLNSCKDDDPGPGNSCTNFNLSISVQNEFNTFNIAAQAYGTDPTTENCNAYKNAGLALVDAYKAVEECAITAGQAAEYQMSLQEAEESFAMIEC